VIRNQLDLIKTHEPGTRLDEDPEELHAMRVATRRLRAALTFFRDTLPAPADEVRAELQWLAQGLGAVRDLDVQLGQVAEWQLAADEADPHAFDALADTIRRRRPAARTALLEQLESPRYQSLLSCLNSVLADEAPFLSAGTPVGEAVPPLVRRRHQQLRKAADELTPHSAPGSFHAARIHGKRLRYAVEFVGEAYGKPAQDFVGVMVRLQDVLGDHQDAYVAIDQLRELLASEGANLPIGTVFLMGRVSERYASNAARLREAFRDAYRPVRGKAWHNLSAAFHARTA
jgi:CHAD domain-containing protein